LRAGGHEAYTPTLTGLGERVHLARPEIDLTTHVTDIVNVLEYEDLREVALVGHGYGGFVIAGVAQRVPWRLAHLVYLDAFLPRDGESLLEAEGADEATASVWVEDTGSGLAFPIPSEAELASWVTSPEEVRWLARNLTPHPFKTCQEALRLENPAVAAIPATYIDCVQERSPWKLEAICRAQDAAWRLCKLPTGRDAMVTMPRELEELFLDIVEARDDNRDGSR
jgi:pimeloyl-ACP methyl ester carboxylesterase